MVHSVRDRHVAGPGGVRRRLVGLAAAVALGLTAITGCAAGQVSQTADQVPNHDSGFGQIGAMGVVNALIGTDADKPGAVAFASGTSAPLSFAVTNIGTESDTLTSVTTTAGTVTLSGPVTVLAKASVLVGTDGTVQATLAASSDLKYGVSIPLTFTFATAGALTINVPVTIPAQREADRAGTDIYPPAERNMWEQSTGE